MFLKEKHSGHLVAVVKLDALFNPYEQRLACRSQYGEEEQDLEYYAKEDLLFPSDEALPECWLNPAYRDVH